MQGSNTRLAVLGFLTYGAAHGYEIQKQLETSRVETWADVLPGSIYFALKQMTKEGLVEVQRTERAGHRLRAVYAVTEAGREAFRSLLREGLRRAPRSFPSGFYTALGFIDALPLSEVEEAVRALIPALEQELASWDEGETLKLGYVSASGPSYEHLRVLFQNGREHLEADLRMLRRLAEVMNEPQLVGGITAGVVEE